MVSAGLAAGVVVAQQPMKGTVNPLTSLPLLQDPDVACLQSALEAGDPRTGASTWLLRAPPGCIVPWHWHTAQEQLLVVAGDVRAEMADHPPTLLQSGGFAMMPGRMAHQFTCQGPQPCLMFVIFDGAYDIKWGRGSP
jgi:quercetin dioxygenase-like cupin family protein